MKRLSSNLTAVALLAVTSPAMTQANYRVETVAEGLSFPWSIAFLPGEQYLVTERGGRMLRLANGETTAIDGVPAVFAKSQGGLFDVVLAPDFTGTRWLYLTYAHGDDDANGLRLARARLESDQLHDVEVLFESKPLKDTPVHYGGRLVILPDQTLLFAMGDGFDYREQAQRLNNHFGKTLRLNLDGSIPEDNPFAGRHGVRPEIWSYGHRNPQGLVVDRISNVVYLHEHGPRGGDELNRVEPGRNYGWPVITYGIDYSGAYVSPYTEREGMEQPMVHWTPSIAPAGMALYDGGAFPEWQGRLLITALVEKSVRLIELRAGNVVGQTILFQELDTRLRDVRVGPDGYVYLLTDEPAGRVLRIIPN